MKRLTTYLCAAAMAVGLAGLGAPAALAQTSHGHVQVQFGGQNVIEVQHRDYRQGPSGARGGFERRGDRAYYRGHRGYRQARPGWRQYQGWWFPPAAFMAGAILGGTVVQPAPPQAAPRPGRLSRAHVEWCYDRYRSYRASDNTFQPYQGPRRACRSPYG